jgi:hypothetical protein
MLFKPDLASIKEAAAAEAELLLPQHYACRKDLVSNTPTDLVTRADGSRVAGTVNVSDIIPGSSSPAIWAYYPTLTALAAVTFVLGVMAAYLGAWIPLSSIAEAWRAGTGVMGSLWYALKITVVGWMLWGLLPAAGVAAQMYYWYLVLSEQEPSRDFYRMWMLATAIILVGCVVVPFVGPLGCAVTSLLSIIGFRMYIGTLEKSRDDIVRDVSHDTRTATLLKGRAAQEEARRVQAANSLRDTTNLIPLGRTNETLRKDGDLLTADAGAMLCISVKDVEDAHILVKGESGSGKTTRFLKPFLRWFIAATWDVEKNRGTWGIAVFDGIKNLAAELRDSLQVVVSPKTHRLNMLQGVPVEIASMTLMQMRSKGPDEGGWQGKVEAMCRHALRMMEIVSELKDANGDRAFPNIHYSWTCADDWVKNPKLRSVTMKKVYDEFQHVLAPPYIQKTWTYWCVEWVDMAHDTKTSILGIWTQWIDALVAHPDMQAWCGHESDIDLLDFWCRQAGRAGVDCPPTVYGVGGKIAATIIEAALENRIMQRVHIGGGERAKWIAAGENDVLIPIDEFGRFARPGHVEFVTAARSLGGHHMVAYQDDGMLDEGLGGKDAGDTYRNNCHVRVTFKTDDRSLEESCEKAGKRERWFTDDSNVAHAPLLELTRIEMANGLKDGSRNRLINLAGAAAGVIARRKHMLQTNHRDQGDMDASNPLRAIATLRGKTRATTTIESNELAMELVVPGMALVSYPRAKVLRRGICYMAADYEMTGGPGAAKTAQARVENQPPHHLEMPTPERVKEAA